MIVSADEHLVEPAEFWDGWLIDGLPAAERDLAPRIEGGALVVDGQAMPVFLLFPELIAYSDAQPGVGDIAGRLAIMDAEGIDVSLLFPQRAMGMFATKDPAFRTRCFTLYNEWLADFCRRSNGRLHGVAVLPTVYEPEATADYLVHLKSLGFPRLHDARRTARHGLRQPGDGTFVGGNRGKRADCRLPYQRDAGG